MKKCFLIGLLLACLIGCTAAPETPEPAAQETAPAETVPAKPPVQQDAAEEKPAEREPVIPVLDTVLDAASPKLKMLSLDDGYRLDFDPELRTYTIRIPAGRVRVPELSAEAEEGLTVALSQPVVPDEDGFGYGYVYVTDETGARGDYTVLVIRDETLGFQLQYLDRYAFAPEGGTQQELSFVSSAPETASVDASGVVTALALSDEPATITAYSGQQEIGQLRIDRIVSAPLNVFLILGQSNAAGTYDIPSGVTETGYTLKQMTDVDRPEAGTVFCVDVNYAGEVTKDFYDLSEGRPGFSPALGKR